MPFFDAQQFWDVLIEQSCTWYYAAPTMHMMILAAQPDDAQASIRLIVNAAGPLQHSLAESLREKFNKATVLPCYGMTECMPISSPPPNYALERPGTSGQAIGPELGIMDDNGNFLNPGQVGNIMVIGMPVMQGYEKTDNKDTFLQGWFKTGDLGYLDEDGYLFITGRSKEAINRGGEIIAPGEIEEACATHPSIKQCVAFSGPHSTLQARHPALCFWARLRNDAASCCMAFQACWEHETVGLLVVMEDGCMRVGLNGIVLHVQQRLHTTKWPTFIVYSDGLPTRGATRKVVRVGLDKMMNLPMMSDKTPIVVRHFETSCFTSPAGHTELTPAGNVAVNLTSIEKKLKTIPCLSQSEVVVVNSRDNHQNQMGSLVAFTTCPTVEEDALLSMASKLLPDYMLPTTIVPVDVIPRLPTGGIDVAALALQEGNAAFEGTATEKSLRQLWKTGLDQDVRGKDPDFFTSGGNSLSAGRLSHAIRDEFKVPWNIMAVFKFRSLAAMAKEIDRLSSIESAALEQLPPRAKIGGPQAKLSSTAPAVLIVQLLPLLLFQAIVTCMNFMTFLSLLLFFTSLIPGGYEIGLLCAIALTVFATTLVWPLVGIMLKWAILGRLGHGRFRLWGRIYLQWYVVDQILKICGKGIFTISPGMMRAYYRLLGARIGENVHIHPDADVGEADLLIISDNVSIDRFAIVRPFAAVHGTMKLAPIQIGAGSVIATRCVLTPGCHVRPNTYLPPNCSSAELKDSDPKFAKLDPSRFSGPPMYLKLLVGWPIVIVVNLIANSPWLAIIHLAVQPLKHERDMEDFLDTVAWFIMPTRIVYSIILRVTKETVVPFIYLGCVILIKRSIIGKFVPGDRGPTAPSRVLFNYWLMATLLPDEKLAGVLPLLGAHWEYVSIIYRLMGAKVGKNVFWPGSGFRIAEFDLLEVGDNVVFGSRSIIMTRDSEKSLPVKIMYNANVADRCYLSPGVTVEPFACLGSGTFAAAQSTFHAGSLWVGLSGGNPVLLESGYEDKYVPPPETTAFGRSAYQGEAQYSFVPWWLWPSLATLWHSYCKIHSAAFSFTALYWSMLLADARENMLDIDLARSHTSEKENFRQVLHFFVIFLSVYIFVHAARKVLDAVVLVGVKYCVIGQRLQGEMSWDVSDYNYRWKLFLMFQNLAPTLTSSIQGSAWIVWYYRALGCQIGTDVCLYPTGSDPMMTEPDLVRIEDGACINQAYIICHTNTRGNFALNTIYIGKDVTIHSGSKIMGGSVLEERCTVKEHTLVMVGDIMEKDMTWQGWPVRDFGIHSIEDIATQR
ncbi:hypothetical protein CYMTET_51249, partial [Cymbomonas tetramitiformis]